MGTAMSRNLQANEAVTEIGRDGERERERDLVYIRVDTVRLHPTNRLPHECTKIPATGKPGKSQSAAQPQKRKTPRCWHPGMELMELGDTQAARCQMSGSGFRFRMLV